MTTVAPKSAGGRPRPGGPRIVLIVVGVVVLAIVAVAAVLLLQPERSDPPVGAASATPSVPSTSTPDRSTTAPASASPTPGATSGGEWEMGRIGAQRDDPSMGANLMGVQWHEGPGWIAFGSQQANEDGLPGIWTSGDGRSWTLADLPDGLAGTPVLDIARGDIEGSSRYVAVVAGYTGLSRVLTSTDGSSWELATTPETATLIHAVAHGTAGFLATGTVGGVDPGEPPSGRVWRSSDGAEWGESAPPALGRRAQAFDIAHLVDRYVAVGFPAGSGPPLLAWVSTDAADWSEHEVSPPSGVGCLCAVTDAAAGRIVVLGTSDHAYVALSADGQSWTSDRLHEAGAYLNGADVTEDGAIVVTGSLNIADGPRDALVWVRDPESTELRAVDWRAELPGLREDGIGLGGAVYVAVGPERTLILLSDGTVFLTADRLP